jgi:hypothetical protein
MVMTANFFPGGQAQKEGLKRVVAVYTETIGGDASPSSSLLLHQMCLLTDMMLKTKQLND